jgi:hypothetical protein
MAQEKVLRGRSSESFIHKEAKFGETLQRTCLQRQISVIHIETQKSQEGPTQSEKVGTRDIKSHTRRPKRIFFKQSQSKDCLKRWNPCGASSFRLRPRSTLCETPNRRNVYQVGSRSLSVFRIMISRSIQVARLNVLHLRERKPPYF